MPGHVLLDSSGINFAYGKTPVLRDVAMSLKAGETVVLIGPNGSGKSTLLRTLLGHLHAKNASISWSSKPLTQWRPRDLARFVAYLPQVPTADPWHTVLDVLRLGRAPYWGSFGLESVNDVRAVETAANDFELSDLLNRRVDELSGGQRQRLFIARCLAQQPSTLLLDEPATFLDLRHQLDLLKLLRSMVQTRGIGVLLTSHELSLSTSMADRVVLLVDGRIASEGSPADVMGGSALDDAYQVRMERFTRADGSVVVVPGA